MNRKGFTLIEILAILALIAILIIILIALCARSGPLTAADGRTAAGAIHGDLLDLIATSTTPVSEIVAEIRQQLLDQAEGVQGREGATDFIDGLCAELRTLIQNRIQSSPEELERNRLRQFLQELDELCREARQRAAGP